jgi:hypothetical protein
MRSVRSVLHHTKVPFTLVVVDNGSSDDTRGWLGSIEDPRVVLVELEENVGVPAGRNTGIAALSGDEEFVVLIDSDTEVLADWYLPFVAALRANPLVAIAAESGRNIFFGTAGPILSAPKGPGFSRCDVAAGHCMVLSRRVLDEIGRFDERLALSWHDDDYSLRAARLGFEMLRVGSGLVIHSNGPSANGVADARGPGGVPSLLAAQSQSLLETRHNHQQSTPTSPFLVLADADAVLRSSDTLLTYSAAFTAADAVALVIVGVDADPETIGPAIEAAALEAGFNLSGGPKVMVMTPSSNDPAGLHHLADEVHLCLGPPPSATAFAHLGRVLTGDPDELRRRAAGVWRARPVALQPA